MCYNNEHESTYQNIIFKNRNGCSLKKKKNKEHWYVLVFVSYMVWSVKPRVSCSCDLDPTRHSFGEMNT